MSRPNFMPILHLLILNDRPLRRMHSSRLINNRLPIPISSFPLPSSEEIFTQLEMRECVGFGVEDDFVQGEDIVWSEEEVEVF